MDRPPPRSSLPAIRNPQSAIPDESLVAAVNRGEGPAFDAIYYRYRDWVVRLAHRFTGNDADALDVLQETFAYFFRKFPGFRLTASMTTFLYPVVRNFALEIHRKKRTTTTAAAYALEELPGFAVADDNQTRSDLAAARSEERRVGKEC